MSWARPEPTKAAAWTAWSDLDTQFQPWLRASYGSQLTRSWLSGPVSLDKVQPFMATRRSPAGRVLVVVLDGMGFAQWTRIRERSTFRILHASGTLAMLPTITEVSRQAIAAGTLPNQFADTLASTSKEEQRWRAAWDGTARDPRWLRIDGVHVAELEAVPFDVSEAIGVVISATDKLMHSAELLGDIGLHASLDAWLDAQVLDELVRRASNHGFDVWITADHGNLECIPSTSRQEGVFVDRAGTRIRRYKNRTLRDEAKVSGDRWDAIPGLPPEESKRLLFAIGRTGWGPSRVSHGGLSIDEVIVPFIQVAGT